MRDNTVRKLGTIRVVSGVGIPMKHLRRLLVAFVTSGALLSVAFAQAARQPESLNVRAFAVSFAASSIDVDGPPEEYHGDWPRPSPE